MSVIFIGAISVATVVFMLKNGVISTQNSSEVHHSYQAKLLAQTCLEEALERIRENTAFTGQNTLTFTNGDCSFLVIGNNQEKVIEARGNSFESIKNIRVEVSSVNPQINISSFEIVN